MPRYKMEDGTVVDTKNASANWEEKSDSDGRNRIGRSSRSQWHDQALHRSRRGRYYLETASRVQGQRDRCEWVSPQAAAAWLLVNSYDIPDGLSGAAEEMSE